MDNNLAQASPDRGPPAWIRSLWTRLLGSIEPQDGYYLKEAQARNLAVRHFQPVFLQDKNAYLSDIGFFRLWRGKNGLQALLFAPNLKNFENDDTLLTPAKVWQAGKEVNFGNIQTAIIEFTENYNEIHRERGILYGTDANCLMLRHAAIAYCDGNKNGHGPVISLRGYLNEIGARNLANPYGDEWWARFLRSRVDQGVDLSRLLKKGRASTPEEVEDAVFLHFLSARHHILRGENPIDENDRKLQPLYHLGAEIFWFTTGLFSRGTKYSSESIEAIAQTTRIVRNSTGLIANLIAGALYPLLLIEFGYLIFEILHYKVRDFYRARKVRKTPEYRLATRFSFIEPFKEIFSTIDRAVYKAGTLMTGPTFDGTKPLLLHKAEDERLAILLGRDSSPIFSSMLIPHFKEKSVIAKRIRRPDGLNIIELINEKGETTRGFLIYDPSLQRKLGSNALPPQFSQELLEYFKEGDVVEITYGAEPKSRTLSRKDAIQELKAHGLSNPEHCLRCHGTAPDMLPKNEGQTSLTSDLLPSLEPQATIGVLRTSIRKAWSLAQYPFTNNLTKRMLKAFEKPKQKLTLDL